MSPLILFLFRIVSIIWDPLRFYMNFWMDFSVSAKNVIGILIGFTSNLLIILCSIDILVLSLLIHGQICFIYLCICFIYLCQFISAAFCGFHCINLLVPWLIHKCFILFDAIVNGIFLISFSDCSQCVEM